MAPSGIVAETHESVVLIIDDEPEIARLMQLMLSWVVTRAVVATDPFVGLETARGLKPDLILCDISMPGMNGFDLRRELATDPALGEIPFVFVSSNARVDSQLTGLRLGATAYLTKPIRRETLVATVLHQLERRQAQQAAVVKPIMDAPSAGHFGGNLDTIAMPELLQLLESSRSTGVLEVKGRATTGEMTLARGALLAARAGVLAGEDAALELVWTTEGDFHFTRRPVGPREDGGGLAIGRLLVEAAWMKDELARLGSLAPRPADAVVIVDGARMPELFAGIGIEPWPSWKEMARSGEAIPVASLAAMLGTSVYRCRALLGAGYERGAVRVIPTDGQEVIGPFGSIRPPAASR